MRPIVLILAGLALGPPASAQVAPDPASLHLENSQAMQRRADRERMQAFRRDAVAAEARARTVQALRSLEDGRGGVVLSDYAADAADAAAAIARRQDAMLAESNARIRAIRPASAP